MEHSSVESLAAQKYVDTLLGIRRKHLRKGWLPKRRIEFQKDVLASLLGSVRPETKREEKEFGTLAMSFSRLFALYYADENGKAPSHPKGRLAAHLPHLAQHLLAEIRLCTDARFIRPSTNLAKVSVFDIQDKLDELQKHPEKAIANNASTIVCTALNRSDLKFADKLVAEVPAIIRKLRERQDEVVKSYADTIIHIMLNRARPELASELAKGVAAKLKELKGHSSTRIREVASAILDALIVKGDLNAERVKLRSGEVIVLRTEAPENKQAAK
jgi:hypothetical protein